MTKAYFNDIESEIIPCINQAKESIYCAVAWFTNPNLLKALKEKAKEIPVFLVIINDGINNKLGQLNFQEFIDEGGSFYFGNEQNLMHHKFCIIDKKIVINGSYNWTIVAEKSNRENIIITDKRKIVKLFFYEFEDVISDLQKVKKVKKVANYDVKARLLKSFILQEENAIKNPTIVRKSEIKERLDNLGIDYTGITRKSELESLLPIENPTDFDPFDGVEQISKESSTSINVVAPTLKRFMKMVQAKFNWSKAVAIPTDNSLDESRDINYTLEIGDKSTLKKVVQPDGSKVKQFTGQVLNVITSSNVNAMLNNGDIVEKDLMSLKVSRLDLKDKRTGEIKPTFFLIKPRANGFDKREELSEDIPVVTLDVKRVRKEAFKLK